MIKVFYGKKGTGKTKNMLEHANALVSESSGSVVYIDDSNELLTKLARGIRFINVKDYPVEGAGAFLGFICGVASQNYDIETIFIDGVTYIVGEDRTSLESFFQGLERITDDNTLNFYISINGDESEIPPFVAKYV